MSVEILINELTYSASVAADISTSVRVDLAREKLKETFSALEEKNKLLRAALEKIAEQAEARPSEKHMPRDMIIAGIARRALEEAK